MKYGMGGDVVWCPVTLFLQWVTGGSPNYTEKGLFVCLSPFNSSCTFEKLYSGCQLYSCGSFEAVTRGMGRCFPSAGWVTGERRRNGKKKAGGDRSLPGGSCEAMRCWRGRGGGGLLCFRETVEENLKYWPWKTTSMIIIISHHPFPCLSLALSTVFPVSLPFLVYVCVYIVFSCNLSDLR